MQFNKGVPLALLAPGTDICRPIQLLRIIKFQVLYEFIWNLITEPWHRPTVSKQLLLFLWTGYSEGLMGSWELEHGVVSKVLAQFDRHLCVPSTRTYGMEYGEVGTP